MIGKYHRRLLNGVCANGAMAQMIQPNAPSTIARSTHFRVSDLPGVVREIVAVAKVYGVAGRRSIIAPRRHEHTISPR